MVAGQRGDLARIQEALNFIPANDRDVWVRLGMAIKSDLGDLGFNVWDGWSQGAASYNASDAKDVWRGFKAAGGVNIGTLYHEAKAHGWRDSGAHQRPTPADLAKRQRLAAERAKQDAAELAKAQDRTAHQAAAILKISLPAKPDNPYLERKQLDPTPTLFEIKATEAAKILGYKPQVKGEHLTGRLLVVPIKQGDRISTLELIDGEGRKAALAGRGTKAGGYWASQRLPAPGNDLGKGLTLLIGEGVATVLSAKESSGYPGVAALSASNLPAVAKIMRERYPEATLKVLADLVKTSGKPDSHAVEAARIVRGRLAVPNFGGGRHE